MIVTILSAAAVVLCASLVRQLRMADDPWLTEIDEKPPAPVPDWYGGSQVHTCQPPAWYVPWSDRPTMVRSLRIRPLSYVGSAT